MKRLMLRAVFSCAMAVIALPVTKAEVVTNVSVSVNGTAIAGCSETVSLTGDLHVVVRQTADDSGGVHIGVHANAQDVSAVGLTSGLEYRAAAVQNTAANISGPPPAEISDLLLVRLTAPGRGNNLSITLHTHTTVSATGDVSVSFTVSDAVCR
jgi:hypothetical protein